MRLLIAFLVPVLLLTTAFASVPGGPVIGEVEPITVIWPWGADMSTIQDSPLYDELASRSGFATSFGELWPALTYTVTEVSSTAQLRTLIRDLDSADIPGVYQITTADSEVQVILVLGTGIRILSLSYEAGTAILIADGQATYLGWNLGAGYIDASGKEDIHSTLGEAHLTFHELNLYIASWS